MHLVTEPYVLFVRNSSSNTWISRNGSGRGCAGQFGQAIVLLEDRLVDLSTLICPPISPFDRPFLPWRPRID